MAYTYLIGWRKLDRWYYGYRSGNTSSPEKDLWIEYFTSSRYVEAFRAENGEPDAILVHKEFDAKAQAMIYEDRFQRRVGAVRSERWLNRARAGSEFRSPDKYSDESRAKMSASAKARLAVTPKPITQPMRDNARRQVMRINELNLRGDMTPERRAKIAAKLVGNTNGAGKRDEVAKANLSAGTKKRPILSCIKCRKECVVNSFHQHLVKCSKS